MPAEAQNLVLYCLLTALLAASVHCLVRRSLVASMVTAVAASMVNIAHELLVRGLNFRPSDPFFWVPSMFVAGVVIAAPIAFLIGFAARILRGARRVL
jgi:hypothetical protein